MGELTVIFVLYKPRVRNGPPGQGYSGSVFFPLKVIILLFYFNNEIITKKISVCLYEPIHSFEQEITVIMTYPI